MLPDCHKKETKPITVSSAQGRGGGTEAPSDAGTSRHATRKMDSL